MTPHEILGIKETSTLQEAKRAYRKLSKKYHPDLNPSPNSSEIMQKITQAYEQVKYLIEHPTPNSSPDTDTQSSVRFDEDLSNFNSTDKLSKTTIPKRGENIVLLYNGEPILEYSIFEDCKYCCGIGVRFNGLMRKCPQCNGSRTIDNKECLLCAGIGYLNWNVCKTCLGKGRTIKKIKIDTSNLTFIDGICELQGMGSKGHLTDINGNLIILQTGDEP